MSDDRAREARSGKDAEEATGQGGDELALPSGRTLEVRLGPDQRESIALKSRDGAVELRIRITDDGPVVELNAAGLVLQNSGDISLRCNRFSVETEQAISLRTRGDMEQEVEGGYRCRVGQDLAVSAQAGTVEARRGDLEFRANDDLALDGGRVMLNCPRPEEVERRARAVKDLKDLLDLPFQAPGGPQRMPRSEPVDEGQDLDDAE